MIDKKRLIHLLTERVAYENIENQKEYEDTPNTLIKLPYIDDIFINAVIDMKKIIKVTISTEHKRGLMQSSKELLNILPTFKDKRHI